MIPIVQETPNPILLIKALPTLDSSGLGSGESATAQSTIASGPSRAADQGLLIGDLGRIYHIISTLYRTVLSHIYLTLHHTVLYIYNTYIVLHYILTGLEVAEGFGLRV